MNIDKFIGIPHKFNESSFDGCDCLGLVRLYYREHGWPQTFDDGLPITEDNWETPEAWHRLFRYLHSNFDEVNDPSELNPGAVVVFKIGDDMHLGILLDNYGRMLASQIPVVYGKTTSTIYKRSWWMQCYKRGYNRRE